MFYVLSSYVYDICYLENYIKYIHKTSIIYPAIFCRIKEICLVKLRLRGQKKAGITSESKTLRHFDRFFRLELKSCLRGILGSLLSSQRLLSRTCLFFSNGRSTFTSNLYATKGRESEIVFLVILKNSLCSYRTCYQSNIRRQSKGIINYCRFLKGS